MVTLESLQLDRSAPRAQLMWSLAKKRLKAPPPLTPNLPPITIAMFAGTIINEKWLCYDQHLELYHYFG